MPDIIHCIQITTQFPFINYNNGHVIIKLKFIIYHTIKHIPVTDLFVSNNWTVEKYIQRDPGILTCTRHKWLMIVFGKHARALLYFGPSPHCGHVHWKTLVFSILYCVYGTVYCQTSTLNSFVENKKTNSTT